VGGRNVIHIASFQLTEAYSFLSFDFMLNFLTVLKNDTRYLKMYFLVLNKVQGASFIVLGSIVMSLEVGDM